MTFDRHLPLDERILRIDHIQARRYSKLSGVALEIATQGILRHLRACDRMDVNPDTSAVREIIDDALNGRGIHRRQPAEQILRRGSALGKTRQRRPLRRGQVLDHAGGKNRGVALTRLAQEKADLLVEKIGLGVCRAAHRDFTSRLG